MMMRVGTYLREADVVADAHPDASIRRVDHRHRIPGAQRVGLLESDLTGHVDVEQVDLAVLG